MKKEFFAAVLAGTMLLAGCANAAPPATVTTIGTSSPTIKPTETVPSTTAPTTAPTTEPVKPTDPDYDEYFSSVATESPDWRTANAASLYWKNNQLIFRHNGTSEVIFETPYGHWDNTKLGWNGYYSFFDASIDEDTDGLYRIFGPTGQIDLLVSGIPHAKNVSAGLCSNVEVILVLLTQESLEACQRVWDTYYEDLGVNNSGESLSGIPREVWGNGEDFSLDYIHNSSTEYSFFRLVRRELHSYIPCDVYYYNTLTGEYHQIQVSSMYPSGNVMLWWQSVVTYPDGTERPEEMLEKNESSWWLDDYYTK